MMEKGNVLCSINWLGDENSLTNRTFLFCVNEKCVSGKVLDVVKLSEKNMYEIEVNFIDSDYLKDEKKVGNRITIQEASKVLSEGLITNFI
jgi:hypothetical protein